MNNTLLNYLTKNKNQPKTKLRKGTLAVIDTLALHILYLK